MGRSRSSLSSFVVRQNIEHGIRITSRYFVTRKLFSRLRNCREWKKVLTRGGVSHLTHLLTEILRIHHYFNFDSVSLRCSKQHQRFPFATTRMTMTRGSAKFGDICHALTIGSTLSFAYAVVKYAKPEGNIFDPVWVKDGFCVANKDM